MAIKKRQDPRTGTRYVTVDGVRYRVFRGEYFTADGVRYHIASGEPVALSNPNHIAECISCFNAVWRRRASAGGYCDASRLLDALARLGRRASAAPSNRGRR